MLDDKIKMLVKVMYAINGQYTEEHSRQLEINLAQNIKKDNVDYKLKFNFLKVDEKGDFTRIGSDLVSLNFTGYKNTGYERCRSLEQSLANS
jgi:hypothetical protein